MEYAAIVYFIHEETGKPIPVTINGLESYIGDRGKSDDSIRVWLDRLKFSTSGLSDAWGNPLIMITKDGKPIGLKCIPSGGYGDSSGEIQYYFYPQ
jgi:hypothetical protein